MRCFINKIAVYECAVIAAIVVIAITLQLTTGDFPVDIFTFPLNVIIVILSLISTTVILNYTTSISKTDIILLMLGILFIYY